MTVHLQWSCQCGKLWKALSGCQSNALAGHPDGHGLEAPNKDNLMRPHVAKDLLSQAAPLPVWTALRVSDSFGRLRDILQRQLLFARSARPSAQLP